MNPQLNYLIAKERSAELRHKPAPLTATRRFP